MKAIILGVVLVAAIGVAAGASAKPRARHRSLLQASHQLLPPARDFTDPGRAAPSRRLPAYMQQATQFNRQPYEVSSPGMLWQPDPGMFR